MLLIRRLLVHIIALTFIITISPDLLHAAPAGSSVVGVLSLPAGKRKKAPTRGMAFVKRAKNPLQDPPGHDPRNEIVVVLDGGKVDEVDRKPHAREYVIAGENFETDIFPVVIGSKVEIRNKGRKSPQLYSKTIADFLPSEPINPKGIRETKPVTEAHKPIDIRAQDSVHFLGRVVAFEHRYFAVPSFNGRFEIKGVPPGTWTVKLWYRDGWVTNLPKITVSLPAAKRGAKPVRVNLPASLKTGAGAQ